MALRKGENGAAVSELQTNLVKLGFKLNVDGDFGENTHNAVITLQNIFGYDVDGIVGPGTEELIKAQVGYGWNLEAARKAFVTPPAANS